jgi:hypothetical protein
MAEVLSNGPQSPGSLREFVATRGYDAVSGLVQAEYSSVLAQYRIELAESRGLTLEELHQGILRDVGGTVLAEARPQLQAETS